MAFEDGAKLLPEIPVNASALPLSDRQMAVQAYLHKIDDKALDFYNAGLYFFYTETFPARDYFICLTFFLLTEAFLESDEGTQMSEFELRIKGDLSRSIKEQGCFPDDVCEEIIKNNATSGKIKGLWKELANLSKDKAYKWHFFIKRFRPKISDALLQRMVSDIKKAIAQFHNGRHYEKDKPDNINYEESIGIVEDFILALEQPYLEEKEVLDGILEDANARAD